MRKITLRVSGYDPKTKHTTAPATLREWAERATPEKSVQAELVTLLEANGWHVIITDVHKGVLDHGERGKRLVALRPRIILGPNTPCEVMFVEVKRPRGGKVLQAQKVYHAHLCKLGFTVIVARSWDELVERARECSIKVERTV